MDPTGVEPWMFRAVGQRVIHCATRATYLSICKVSSKFYTGRKRLEATSGFNLVVTQRSDVWENVAQHIELRNNVYFEK